MFGPSGRPQSAGDWLTMLLVLATAISLAITVENSGGEVRVLASFAVVGALGVLVAWFLMFLKPEEKYGVPIGAVGIWLVGLFFMVVFSLAAWFTAWRKSTKRDSTKPA